MDGIPRQPISKRLRKKTCYACHNQATGFDHVPPKFLFPEYADLGHKYGDLRRGLLTVPSCDTHNTDATGDDTYFVISVVGCIRNNQIAQDHFDTKIRRSIDEDPQVAKWYAEMVLGDTGPRRQVGTLDRERLDRATNKIVKGLYYKITGRKIISDEVSGILYLDLYDADLSVLGIYRAAEAQMKKHEKFWIHYKSESPKIFKADYFLDISNARRIAFKLQFYEGFRIWVVHEGTTDDTVSVREAGLVRE